MLHLERLVGIDRREIGELGATLDLLGSMPFTERSLARPGSLSFARMGRSVPSTRSPGTQASGSNHLRGHKGVATAGHVTVRTDVPESLIVDIEDARDVTEALRAGGGGIHGLDELRLFDAGRIKFELAGLLAQPPATFMAASSSRLSEGSTGAKRLLRCLRLFCWRSRRSRRSAFLEGVLGLVITLAMFGVTAILMGAAGLLTIGTGIVFALGLVRLARMWGRGLGVRRVGGSGRIERLSLLCTCATTRASVLLGRGVLRSLHVLGLCVLNTGRGNLGCASLLAAACSSRAAINAACWAASAAAAAFSASIYALGFLPRRCGRSAGSMSGTVGFSNKDGTSATGASPATISAARSAARR